MPKKISKRERRQRADNIRRVANYFEGYGTIVGGVGLIMGGTGVIATSIVSAPIAAGFAVVATLHSVFLLGVSKFLGKEANNVERGNDIAMPSLSELNNATQSNSQQSQDNCRSNEDIIRERYERPTPRVEFERRHPDSHLRDPYRRPYMTPEIP